VFERGQDSQRCAFYQRAYDSLCPADWVEEWEELREKGLWWVGVGAMLDGWMVGPRAVRGREKGMIGHSAQVGESLQQQQQQQQLWLH